MELIDYLIMAAYLVGMIGLGYLFKEQKDGTSYFLGGKSLSWIALTISCAATQLSAISFISAPAFVGMKAGGGMKWLTFEFAVPLAMIFLMFFIVPPLYRANVLSIYSFLEKRFGTTSRTLISIVFQISRALATGVGIYTVALILNGVTDLSVELTILLVGVVTLIYSYQGGMKAVVVGDVIQMAILVAGLVICLGYGLGYLGGWSEFVSSVDASRLQVIDFQSYGTQTDDQFGFWPMLLGGFFLYASYYGTDQSQAQRMLSGKDLHSVRKILLTNGLMRFPITLLYCIMGLIIGTLAMHTPEFLAKIPANKPDLMMPVFIRDMLPAGITGILIVAIFSAAMSSVSSAINSISATTVEDIFARRRQLSPDQYVLLSRRITLFWGVICVGMSFFTGNVAGTVIEAINKIGSVFYGPILATFFSAILLKRVSGTGANAGLLTGVAVNIYLWLFVPQLFWFWWNAIGFLGAIVTALLVSAFWGKATPTSAEVVIEGIDRRYGMVLVLFFAAMVGLCYWLPVVLGG